MKNLIVGVLVAAVLVGTIAGASVLYKNLGDKYSGGNNSDGGLVVLDNVSGSSTDKDDIKVPSQIDSTTAEQGTTATPTLPSSPIDKSEATTALTTAPQVPQEPDEPKVTLSVPDFEVLDYNGNKVKLSDFAGKPIVVNFWATWCYYCKEEMPDFNKAYAEYPDVVFLMVNATDGVSETVESAKKYVEREGYDFDVYFDTNEEALYAYGVTSFPSTYFIAPNGNLAAYRIGMLDYAMLKQGLSYITE